MKKSTKNKSKIKTQEKLKAIQVELEKLFKKHHILEIELDYKSTCGFRSKVFLDNPKSNQFTVAKWIRDDHGKLIEKTSKKIAFHDDYGSGPAGEFFDKLKIGRWFDDLD